MTSLQGLNWVLINKSEYAWKQKFKDCMTYELHRKDTVLCEQPWVLEERHQRWVRDMKKKSSCRKRKKVDIMKGTGFFVVQSVQTPAATKRFWNSASLERQAKQVTSPVTLVRITWRVENYQELWHQQSQVSAESLLLRSHKEFENI